MNIHNSPSKIGNAAGILLHKDAVHKATGFDVLQQKSREFRMLVMGMRSVCMVVVMTFVVVVMVMVVRRGR